MFKKYNTYICFILIAIFLSSTLISNFSLVYADNDMDSKISADGVILMDARSGEILYDKNMNSSYPPASTTKIMTALLTLESCQNLNEEVIVSKNCESIDGSKIYIFQDEKISVKDLLYALLLSSANDCAYALAEHVGGTFDNFVKMMNERAKKLGCTNTNFVNPHGLYDKNHVTSAHDLACIMREIIKHEEYLTISSTKNYTMSPTNKCKDSRPLWNGNKAIHEANSNYYKYCKASKTGYTIQSLHSYVTYAQKDNQELIVALVHDKAKQFYSNSKQLFEYGFNNFKTKKILSKGDKVISYPLNKDNSLDLIAEKDIYVSLDKNTSSENVLTIPIINLNDLNLPKKTIKQGDFIKEITATYGHKNLQIRLLSNTNYSPTIFSSTSNTSHTSIIYTFIKFLLILTFLISIVVIIIKFIKISKIHKK